MARLYMVLILYAYTPRIKTRKGEYLFRVKWTNGEITSEPDAYLKEDDPATFVAYLQRSGLSQTKKYAWAKEEEQVVLFHFIHDETDRCMLMLK